MPLEPLRTKGKIKPFEVYDIETTTDLKRVYLVGWYDGRQYKYWESDPLPPEDDRGAMAQFLRWRFAKPTKRPQYGHNAGNFDAVFALATIISRFPELSVTIVPSQSSILLMTVEDKQRKKKWEFRDSASTLPDSLDNIAHCFLGERKMGDIDYENLYRDPRRYDYLRKDCVLLWDTLSKYFRLLYDKLGGQAGISAASTALATYRTTYQKRTLPEISERATHLARAAYYGGRCEPFRREFNGDSDTLKALEKGIVLDTAEPPTPYGPTERWTPGRQQLEARGVVATGKASDTILHCYDVNSMYPWAMRKPQPIEELDINGFHPELTGFIDCTVTVQRCHLPILPCRADGKLLFPVGTWRGCFSTAELRLAEKTGQLAKCVFHDAVYFRTADIFSDYVDTLYKFRNKSDPNWSLALDRMAKIALNSLYGKFGSNEVRETIHIKPTFNDMVDRQMQQMPSPLGVDCYIERTEKHASYMLPQISAWITALGRCKLADGLLQCSDEAYYSDTDSIYTSRNLSVGSGLGEWKDEYSSNPIEYAYFLAPKVYVLRHRYPVDENNKPITNRPDLPAKTTNKAKGFAKFAEKLPDNAVAILSSGEAIEVSRFSKARSVIRGDFGLMISQKRCHLDYEKRIFHKDGTSEPREVHL